MKPVATGKYDDATGSSVNPIFSVFPIISIVFFVASFAVSPDAMTEDNLPLNILFAIFGGLFGGLPIILILLYLIGARRRKYILQHGIEGTGRVIKVEESGGQIDDRPLITITLHAYVDDWPTYEVVHNKAVSRHVLDQLVPGAQLIIKVDPRNHKRIMLY